jgi:hypothetical protein
VEARVEGLLRVALAAALAAALREGETSSTPRPAPR